MNAALLDVIAGRWKQGGIPEKGDGHSGERIAELLDRLLCR